MTISVHADLTVQDVNVVLTDAGELVETVQLAEPVLELENACVTEIVSERNAEMTVATLETSVTSVDPNKFVVLTSDVLELVPPIAETPMEPKEFVVTTDASAHAENVLKSQDKTSDAEMDNVSADLNVMLIHADQMDVEEPVDHVKEMLNASTELVSTQFRDVVEMVSARHL